MRRALSDLEDVWYRGLYRDSLERFGSGSDERSPRKRDVDSYPLFLAVRERDDLKIALIRNDNGRARSNRTVARRGNGKLGNETDHRLSAVAPEDEANVQAYQSGRKKSCTLTASGSARLSLWETRYARLTPGWSVVR
jgi:hypothetical protein